MLEGVSDSAELIKRQPQLGQLMAVSEGGHAERSKPSPRIFGKRHGTPGACGCGDNRGAVCLDGAASFVIAPALSRLFHLLPAAHTLAKNDCI
jgi:hypothetical protein